MAHFPWRIQRCFKAVTHICLHSTAWMIRKLFSGKPKAWCFIDPKSLQVAFIQATVFFSLAREQNKRPNSIQATQYLQDVCLLASALTFPVDLTPFQMQKKQITHTAKRHRAKSHLRGPMSSMPVERLRTLRLQSKWVQDTLTAMQKIWHNRCYL